MRPHDLRITTGGPAAADVAGRITRIVRVGFEVRVEVTTEDQVVTVTLPRSEFLELGLDTAYRILEGWGRGRRLRETFGASELERRLAGILRLYAEETLALSHGVHLPRVLAPVRELIAQRLRDAMLRAANSLVRAAAVAVQKG